MRKLLLSLSLCAALLPAPILFTACQTTPERAALNATAVQVVTVDTAMKAWADFVRAGYSTQAQVDSVKTSYQNYYNLALLEKAAWIAYANAPTNATPAQMAAQMTLAAKGQLVNAILGFMPPERVSALMQGKQP